MSGQTQTRSFTPRQIGDLFDLFLVLWSGSLTVLMSILVVGASGIAYALLATPWYRAEALVMPNSSRQTASSLGQLGGLASLAGISIGGGSTQEPLAVLRSRSLAFDFIESSGLVNQMEASGVSFKGGARDASLFFEKNIRTIVEDRKSGLVTVAMSWTDPEIAASWTNAYVSRANEQMRKSAIAEAEANIDYLKSVIRANDIASVQASVGRVLEGELQKLLLAKGNSQFAFKIIDPATAPKYKSRPARKLIALASVMLGGILGAAIVLIRFAWRRRMAELSKD